MNRFFPCAVAIFLVAALCSCSSAVKQSYKGADITVTRMERKGSWEGYTAKDGFEWVVITLSLNTKSTSDELTLEPIQLQTADGGAGESPVKRMAFSGGGEHEREIGFAIPKGAQPKNLKLGDVSFDLEKVQGARG